jgi:hypothetical protein
VRQFLLAYRSVGEGGEAGEWNELTVEPAVSTRLLEGLLCGTHYQFRLAAVNKMGSGSASPVVDVTTKGSKPEAPKLEHFLQVNTTSVTLLLDTWQDGGCQIKAFAIEYRETAGGSNWKLGKIVICERLVVPSKRFLVMWSVHALYTCVLTGTVVFLTVGVM